MGLLNLFSKTEAPNKLERLPSGSFTIDRTGQVVASTLPQQFPEAQVKAIGKLILTTFQSAKEINLPLTEVFIHYASLKITAREQRGGALIFLVPRTT